MLEAVKNCKYHHGDMVACDLSAAYACTNKRQASEADQTKLQIMGTAIERIHIIECVTLPATAVGKLDGLSWQVSPDQTRFVHKHSLCAQIGRLHQCPKYYDTDRIK